VASSTNVPDSEKTPGADTSSEPTGFTTMGSPSVSAAHHQTAKGSASPRGQFVRHVKTALGIMLLVMAAVLAVPAAIVAWTSRTHLVSFYALPTASSYGSGYRLGALAGYMVVVGLFIAFVIATGVVGWKLLKAGFRGNLRTESSRDSTDTST
jgi:thiol:disulfide interchange protein